MGNKPHCIQNIISHKLYTKEANPPINTMTKGNAVVYLAYQSISALWDLLPVVKHTVEVQKLQKFGNYFKKVFKLKVAMYLQMQQT
nr:unnamed protein product [Callosobruchus analis]